MDRAEHHELGRALGTLVLESPTFMDNDQQPTLAELEAFFNAEIIPIHVGPTVKQIPSLLSYCILRLSAKPGIDARIREVYITLHGDQAGGYPDLARQRLLFDPPSPVVDTSLVHNDIGDVRAALVDVQVDFDVAEQGQPTRSERFRFWSTLADVQD